LKEQKKRRLNRRKKLKKRLKKYKNDEVTIHIPCPHCNPNTKCIIGISCNELPSRISDYKHINFPQCQTDAILACGVKEIHRIWQEVLPGTVNMTEPTAIFWGNGDFPYYKKPGHGPIKVAKGLRRAIAKRGWDGGQLLIFPFDENFTSKRIFENLHPNNLQHVPLNHGSVRKHHWKFNKYDNRWRWSTTPNEVWGLKKRYINWDCTRWVIIDRDIAATINMWQLVLGIALTYSQSFECNMPPNVRALNNNHAAGNQ